MRNVKAEQHETAENIQETAAHDQKGESIGFAGSVFGGRTKRSRWLMHVGLMRNLEWSIAGRCNKVASGVEKGKHGQTPIKIPGTRNLTRASHASRNAKPKRKSVKEGEVSLGVTVSQDKRRCTNASETRDKKQQEK